MMEYVALSVVAIVSVALLAIPIVRGLRGEEPYGGRMSDDWWPR